MATKVNAGKKGGSKMIWIIGGVLLVAGGVGLYYFMKKRKKDETDKKGDSQNKGTENKKPSTADTTTTNTTTTTTKTDSPSTSGSTTTTTDSSTTSGSTATNTSGSTATNTIDVGSFSLNTTQRIKAFQDWLDANKPCWLKDTDGKYKNLSKNTGACNRNVGGKGYGTNGTNTQRAWKLFGAEYVKTLSSFEGNGAFSNFESSLDLDL